MVVVNKLHSDSHPHFGVKRIAQWLRRFFLLQARPETVRQKLHAAGLLFEGQPIHV